MEEEFYKFLVREGILFKFLEKINRPLKEYCKDTHPDFYLVIFNCESDDEDFWIDLDDKWVQIVIQKENGKV